MIVGVLILNSVGHFKLLCLVCFNCTYMFGLLFLICLILVLVVWVNSFAYIFGFCLSLFWFDAGGC